MLQQKIVQCPDLPLLPAVALAVLKYTDNERIEIADLAAIIARDPALCAKLLRVVNSSMYGLNRQVTDITQAAALLGVQGVRTLIMGFSLVNVFQGKKSGGFNHLQYWRRWMYAATAGREIASHVYPNRREECFVAALLMDIGVLALDRVLGERYRAAWDRISSHTDLPLIETHMFGMDHAEVGQLLAMQWKLPRMLAIPIGAHHNPLDVEDTELRQITHILWLAGRCADIFVTGSQVAEGIREVRRAFAQQYQMTEPQCDSMLCTIGRKTAELAHLFDVRLNTPVNFEHVVESAAIP